MLDLTRQNTISDLVGIGYKSRYFADLKDKNHDIGWLEIHAEN